MKKRFLYLIALCLLCSVVLSACSMPSLPKLPFLNKDNADIASDPVVAVQNTVNMMDLEGVYSEQLAHRGTLRLTAKDSQTASITIDWPGSATESAHWEMTGRATRARSPTVWFLPAVPAASPSPARTSSGPTTWPTSAATPLRLPIPCLSPITRLRAVPLS